MKKENNSNFLSNKTKREIFKNFPNKNRKINNSNSNSSSKIPKNLKFFQYLSKNAYSIGTNNTFSVFKSINDLLYIIYTDFNKSIICYNLIDNQKINEIKNTHDNFLINIRHYLDKINNKDLILSNDANNIKLWNLINFECILYIKNVNKNQYLFSAYLLADNNNNYMITSNYYFENSTNSDPIKIFDLKGTKIKEIKGSNDGIYLIYNYYDKKLSKNFIIAGGDYFIKSFDYNENKIYNIYYDEKLKKENHINLYIDDKEEEIIKLVEASEEGIIRIWNFHSGKLIKKISLNFKINSICFWNSDYLFIGCRDHAIRLIDSKKEIILKEFKKHNNRVVSIKKIFNPKYGDCLISQSLLLGKIALWIIKDNNLSNNIKK